MTGTRKLEYAMTVLFKMRYCTTFAPLFSFKSNSIDVVYRSGTNIPLMFLFAHRERARTTLELFIWVIRWQRWAANHNPHNLTLLLCEGLVTQIMSEQNKAEACFGNTLQCSDLICYFRGGRSDLCGRNKMDEKNMSIQSPCLFYLCMHRLYKAGNV